MVASRWPKTLPFHPGWLTNSEVILATSDRLDGPYHYDHVLLPPRGAQYWDGRVTHNPRIIKWEGGYALFYTGISHALPDVESGKPLPLSDSRVIAARAAKRVGVALAKDIYGPWTRLDTPILPTRPNTFYSFLTSNPSPCLAPDGSVLLIFKSRSYIGNIHGPMKLGAARARNITGPYEVIGEISLDGEVEDPFIWHNGEQYEMIAKDMTGSLCGERFAGAHFVSYDGLKWKLARQPKAYSLELLWDNGAKRKMGSFERPFLYIENGIAKSLFAAVSDGPGGFANASNTWNAAIRLK